MQPGRMLVLVDGTAVFTLEGLAEVDEGIREVMDEVRETLERGEVYHGGGGAAAGFTIAPAPWLYRRAVETDAAWMAAIKRAFPRRRAGDVRYTEDAHGEPGTDLRAAYDAYVEARALWDVMRAAHYAEMSRARAREAGE